MSAVAPSMTGVKLTKAQADFRRTDTPPTCHTCVHRRGSGCELVRGMVYRDTVCDFYEGPESGTRDGWLKWDLEHMGWHKGKWGAAKHTGTPAEQAAGHKWGEAGLAAAKAQEAAHGAASSFHHPPSQLPLPPVAKVWGKDRTAEYLGRDLHAEGIWAGDKGRSSVGTVIFDKQGRLLLREPKGHFGGVTWSFAKGGLEKGEHPVSAARRETLEEVGRNPAIVGHVPHSYMGSVGRTHYYLAHVDDSEHPEFLNGETDRLTWATPQEAEKLLSMSQNPISRERDLWVLHDAVREHARLYPEVSTPLPPRTELTVAPSVSRPHTPKPHSGSGGSPIPGSSAHQAALMQQLGELLGGTVAPQGPSGPKMSVADYQKLKGIRSTDVVGQILPSVASSVVEGTRDWTKWNLEHAGEQTAHAHAWGHAWGEAGKAKWAAAGEAAWKAAHPFGRTESWSPQDHAVVAAAQEAASKMPSGKKFSGPGPMTTDDFKAHRQHVEQQLTAHGANDLMRSPFSTHISEDRVGGVEGMYQPERVAQHRQMIDEIMRNAAEVPNDRRALVTAGLGGAGKSTTLRKNAAHEGSVAHKLGIKYGSYDEHGNGVGEPTNFLTLNPDNIKEEMARRGMIPEINELSPMERSTFAHEEASHITHQLAQRAMAEGKNHIWDITLNSVRSGDVRVAPLKEAGYRVGGLMVDVSPEHSLQNAYARHLHGQEAFNQGKGHGGRFVPSDLILGAKDPSGQYLSKNRAAFEAMKQRGVFDRTITVNNEGNAGQIVGESGLRGWKEWDLEHPGHRRGPHKATGAPGRRGRTHYPIREQIDRYKAGEIPWADLHDFLATYDYRTPSHFRPGMNEDALEEADRNEPGTWGEVSTAHAQGRLSDAEYDRVVASIATPRAEDSGQRAAGMFSANGKLNGWWKWDQEHPAELHAAGHAWGEAGAAAWVSKHPPDAAQEAAQSGKVAGGNLYHYQAGHEVGLRSGLKLGGGTGVAHPLDSKQISDKAAPLYAAAKKAKDTGNLEEHAKLLGAAHGFKEASKAKAAWEKANSVTPHEDTPGGKGKKVAPSDAKIEPNASEPSVAWTYATNLAVGDVIAHPSEGGTPEAAAGPHFYVTKVIHEGNNGSLISLYGIKQGSFTGTHPGEEFLGTHQAHKPVAKVGHLVEQGGMFVPQPTTESPKVAPSVTVATTPDMPTKLASEVVPGDIVSGPSKHGVLIPKTVVHAVDAPEHGPTGDTIITGKQAEGGMTQQVMHWAVQHDQPLEHHGHVPATLEEHIGKATADGFDYNAAYDAAKAQGLEQTGSTAESNHQVYKSALEYNLAQGPGGDSHKIAEYDAKAKGYGDAIRENGTVSHETSVATDTPTNPYPESSSLHAIWQRAHDEHLMHAQAVSMQPAAAHLEADKAKVLAGTSPGSVTKAAMLGQAAGYEHHAANVTAPKPTAEPSVAQPIPPVPEEAPLPLSGHDQHTMAGPLSGTTHPKLKNWITWVQSKGAADWAFHKAKATQAATELLGKPGNPPFDEAHEPAYVAGHALGHVAGTKLGMGPEALDSKQISDKAAPLYAAAKKAKDEGEAKGEGYDQPSPNLEEHARLLGAAHGFKLASKEKAEWETANGVKPHAEGVKGKKVGTAPAPAPEPAAPSASTSSGLTNNLHLSNVMKGDILPSGHKILDTGEGGTISTYKVQGPDGALTETPHHYLDTVNDLVAAHDAKVANGNWIPGGAPSATPAALGTHEPHWTEADLEQMTKKSPGETFSFGEKVPAVGTNGGQWYEDGAGHAYFLKGAQSDEHAMNEVAGSLAYQHAGVAAQKVSLVKMNNGHVRALSHYVPGLKPILYAHDATEQTRASARAGAGMDALMSHYDLTGLVTPSGKVDGPNLFTDANGNVVRLDLGGTGKFRAQGGIKPSWIPGSWAAQHHHQNDYETIRKGDQGKLAYGETGPGPENLPADMRQSLAKAATLDLAKYHQDLLEHGISKEFADQQIAVMKARQEHLKSEVLSSHDLAPAGTASPVEPSVSAEPSAPELELPQLPEIPSGTASHKTFAEKLLQGYSQGKAALETGSKTPEQVQKAIDKQKAGAIQGYSAGWQAAKLGLAHGAEYALLEHHSGKDMAEQVGHVAKSVKPSATTQPHPGVTPHVATQVAWVPAHALQPGDIVHGTNYSNGSFGFSQIANYGTRYKVLRVSDATEDTDSLAKVRFHLIPVDMTDKETGDKVITKPMMAHVSAYRLKHKGAGETKYSFWNLHPGSNKALAAGSEWPEYSGVGVGAPVESVAASSSAKKLTSVMAKNLKAGDKVLHNGNVHQVAFYSPILAKLTTTNLAGQEAEIHHEPTDKVQKLTPAHPLYSQQMPTAPEPTPEPVAPSVSTAVPTVSASEALAPSTPSVSSPPSGGTAQSIAGASGAFHAPPSSYKAEYDKAFVLAANAEGIHVTQETLQEAHKAFAHAPGGSVEEAQLKGVWDGLKRAQQEWADAHKSEAEAKKELEFITQVGKTYTGKIGLSFDKSKSAPVGASIPHGTKPAHATSASSAEYDLAIAQGYDEAIAAWKQHGVTPENIRAAADAKLAEATAMGAPSNDDGILEQAHLAGLAQGAGKAAVDIKSGQTKTYPNASSKSVIQHFKPTPAGGTSSDYYSHNSYNASQSDTQLSLGPAFVSAVQKWKGEYVYSSPGEIVKGLKQMAKGQETSSSKAKAIATAFVNHATPNKQKAQRKIKIHGMPKAKVDSFLNEGGVVDIPLTSWSTDPHVWSGDMWLHVPEGTTSLDIGKVGGCIGETETMVGGRFKVTKVEKPAGAPSSHSPIHVYLQQIHPWKPTKSAYGSTPAATYDVAGKQMTDAELQEWLHTLTKAYGTAGAAEAATA